MQIAPISPVKVVRGRGAPPLTVETAVLLTAGL
jgi:hypothetical protein